MKHARADYDRIQDPAGSIPDDEPVFLIRGQDKFAAEAVRGYARLVQNDNPEMAKVCRDWADKMDAWPKKKSPDLEGQ